MSAQMIAANVMSQQVAAGTFIRGAPSSGLGPTIADAGLSGFPVGSSWIVGSDFLTTMPGISAIFAKTRAPRTAEAARQQALLPPKRRMQVQTVPVTRPPVSRSPIPTTGVGLPTNIINEAPNMGLDLGQLIGNLGGQYINARYPAETPWQMSPQIQPVFNPFSSVPEYLGFGGDPAVTGTPAACAVPKGFYVTASGQLRKKARRRRRRLATPSDIKDLAALSAVTNGPEKKAWIATHPS